MTNTTNTTNTINTIHCFLDVSSMMLLNGTPRFTGLAPGQEKPSRPAGSTDEFTDQEIEDAFAFIDLDRNRFLGAAELRHILICMGELITDEEVDEMIRMCDTGKMVVVVGLWGVGGVCWWCVLVVCAT